MKGYIHSIETFGAVDGPGIRYVVFMQGCPLRCLFCHNPDSWKLKDGKKMSVKELITDIKKYTNYIKSGGVTISGGLYPENVFEKTQVGFRVDTKGYKIKQWIGNQYFIVGGYGQLGDVLVTDLSNDNFPIYALEHDNWKNIQKISNSVEDFSKIISLINKTNINDVDKCNKLKDDIQKIITCDFWDIQIDSAKD